MFSSIIGDAIRAENDRGYDRDDNRHWPSEASIVISSGVIGPCHRERYFQRRGYEQDSIISLENIRKMRVGKAIEELEIESAKLAGIWIDDDVPFQFEHDGITISGKLDAIYRDRDERRVCVEYKTSSGWSFVKTVFGGTGAYSRDYALPRMEHVLQTILYLHALKDLSYGIIFYINRDNMETIEHKIELRGDYILINGKKFNITIDMILTRYKELSNYLCNDIVPPPDYTLEYPDDEIDDLYATKKISKWEYDRWKKDGTSPCDIRCSFCNWSETCRALSCSDVDDIEEDDAPLISFKGLW